MSSLDQDNEDKIISNNYYSCEIIDEIKSNEKRISDIKSKRNKKRLEQMKRRKENVCFVDEENDEDKPESEVQIQGNSQQSQKDQQREDEGEFSNFQLVSKRFQSEDSDDLNAYRNNAQCNKEDQGSVLSESLEEENKNDIEVIVSDLECDLSNEFDTNDNGLFNKNSMHCNSKINSLIYYATSNQKKSFIQFNNQLKYSLEAPSNTGKGTLSYMMALGEIAPDQKQQNYNVENVIEEEPENFAEIEPEKKKREMKMSACLSLNKNANYQNTMSSSGYCTHKGSKSELPNLHSIIQSIQMVLEKRMDLQKEQRLKKILEMKNALVETFKRPNSFNDFVYNNPSSINNNNKDSYSSINKRTVLPLSVDLNPHKSHLFFDEDERLSILNESKNSLIEVKDTNVNFEQELNLQLEKNNIPTDDIGKAFTDANILLTSTTNHKNTGTSSWSSNKKAKKQKVKAISYEITSAIKVEIVNTDTLKQEKVPKQHKQSKSKITFTNNNYINNNINNISINIFPMKQQTNPKLTLNRSNHSSITHDIRKHLLISQGKAQSLFLHKSTFGEELNLVSSKKKSLPVNHVFTYPSSNNNSNVPQRQQKKNAMKHCLTYNNTHKDNNTCISYINFITDHPLPLSDIMISVPNCNSKGNKKIILEAIKYLNFPFSSLDHQKFAIDRLIKSRSSSYCIFIQKDSLNSKTYVIISYLC